MGDTEMKRGSSTGRATGSSRVTGSNPVPATSQWRPIPDEAPDDGCYWFEGTLEPVLLEVFDNKVYVSGERHITEWSAMIDAYRRIAGPIEPPTVEHEQGHPDIEAMRKVWKLPE